ncbi:MAG: helix-turn-helix transcriptional regulator [Alteromonadales bacterium]|jgi:putative transcriptional regulator|nr:helix-turn-helix transcriptional regulator [Alteromonadales bacterium]MCP4985371.1 helix-turn-helix transcriptional regulator [Colwellia sp.]
MAIIIELDVMLAKRKMKLNDLAQMVGITPQNLSVLKNGRAKAIRFSTLEAICKTLSCSPGDILIYQPEDNNNE